MKVIIRYNEISTCGQIFETNEFDLQDFPKHLNDETYKVQDWVEINEEYTDLFIEDIDDDGHYSTLVVIENVNKFHKEELLKEIYEQFYVALQDGAISETDLGNLMPQVISSIK